MATRAIGDCEKALRGLHDTAVVMQTIAVALIAIAKITVLLAQPCEYSLA